MLRSLSWLRPLRRAFGRPTKLLVRHWRRVAIGCALVPAHAAAMLWMPRLLGDALDAMAAGGDPAALAATCKLLLLLAVAEAATRYVSRQTLVDASRYVERDLKDALVAHLQRLPMPWYDRARTGDVTSRLTQDVELVRFVMGPLLLHGWFA